jgi:hypothetical protein
MRTYLRRADPRSVPGEHDIERSIQHSNADCSELHTKRDPLCGESERIVLAAVLILMLIFLPVLIPAAVHAFHALAQLRRRLTPSRAVRGRVEPIPASA